MDHQDFTTTFMVDRTPEETFAAINDVRSWWWGEVEGDTDKFGVEFNYTVPGVHLSRQKVVDLVPGAKVVWHVVDARLEFAKDKGEWIGTEIVFEIAGLGDKTEVRFTHKGLVESLECHDACSSAWSLLVNRNLRNRILTGEVQPCPW